MIKFEPKLFTNHKCLSKTFISKIGLFRTEQTFCAQEPGNAEEIAEFCKVNFGLTFPLMAKVDVNGDQASPLFDWMKGEAKGFMGTSAIKWNFTKFLIDREGNVVKRYGSTDKPASIAKDIEKLL